MADRYSPFKPSISLFEDPPSLELDIEAIITEMTSRAARVEEEILTTLIADRLRELGWTVIAP